MSRKRRKQPREKVVKKAQQRKAEAVGKQVGKQVLIAAVLEQVEEKLAAFASATNSNLQQYMQLVMTSMQNQQSLSRSHDDLNSQFVVFLRLFFTRMNQVIALQNRVYELAVAEVPEDQKPENPREHTIPLVDYDEINELFVLFDEFRQRPDYNDHFRAWYTGEDLSKLPPPPEPEAKEEEGKDDTPEEVPEGVEVYGGDYVRESKSGNGTEEAETERAEDEGPTPDPMPELQGHEDGGTDDPGNEEEGAVVSTV